MGRGSSSDQLPMRVRSQAEYATLWQGFYDEAVAKGRGVHVARAITNERLMRARAEDEAREPLGARDIESYF
jgi:hypothetical protein